jgi:hypothetical protein
MFENRPIKTYKMTTNVIKWRITDEKDTDDTHQQVTSPSKGNKVNYDCLKNKSLTLLKNMAEAMDVSKRYYEQLKQETNVQKQHKNKVNIRCASLVQYMKNKLRADAQLVGWNAMLEWISDQAKLETFEHNNDIDNNNTSKQNNHVGDNNKGGNQNRSEEEDGGKRVKKSSSSDDDEDKNQYEDDKDKANKEKKQLVFGRTIQMKKMNGMNKEALIGILTEMTKHKMKVKKLCQ